MHNDPIARGGKWPPTLVPSPGLLKKLDTRASQCIDGDNGGLWAPAAPIIVGGAGLQVSSFGLFSGGVTTGPKAASGGALILGDNDWPTYATPASRTVVVPLRDVLSHGDDPGKFDTSVPGWTTVLGASGEIACPLPAGHIPKGATLASATVRFRVGSKPASVPASKPTLRIVGFSADGTTGRAVGSISTWQALQPYTTNQLVIPVTAGTSHNVCFECTTPGTSGGSEPAALETTTTPGATVTDGGVVWTCVSLSNAALTIFLATVLPTPASVDAYYNAGQPQSLTMSAPNVNAVIDPSTYVYYVDVQDSANTKNSYHSVVLQFSNIADLRPSV